jgi:hypothetical protein
MKPEKWKRQMKRGWQGNEGMNLRAGTQRGKRRTGSEDRKGRNVKAREWRQEHESGKVKSRR